jgi:HAD superfamily hydrolase (TIGR01509 family)
MLVGKDMNNDIGVEADKLSTESEGSRRILGAVAFDMDGLMLNTEDLYQIVSQTLMQRRGKVYREEVRSQMIGLPAPEAFGVLIREESMTETWQELQRETDEIFDDLLETHLQAMPGLHELLDHLDQKKIRRCVATSSTPTFAHKALGLVGALERVDFVMTAQDVPRGKPHPDIYLASAKRLEVPIERLLVLEDSPTGTKAGVSAGAYVVSVPNEHTKHGSFDGCRWIANTLCDPRIYDVLQSGY